jgi:multidrug efflux pump subunit AcrA (membrane-fusion protein)
VTSGLAAEITLDAFGSERTFAGTVIFIEPSERVIQDVVYYRVTVAFDELDAAIKPGMTADVVIASAEVQDVLSVPLRSVVLNSDGSKHVRVLEGENAVARIVTTGLRGDDGAVEIRTGLSEGDIVITGETAR